MRYNTSYKKLTPPIYILQIQKLQAQESRLKVSLQIDQRLCNIKIVGLPKAVAEMCDIVVGELKSLEKVDKELGESRSQLLY